MLYLCTGVGLFFEREMHDGSYFPVIKDITQKGSAYREGTIKTSEILLSVDGKSCREMSLTELKGAVRIASVTLFVCVFGKYLCLCSRVSGFCVSLGWWPTLHPSLFGVTGKTNRLQPEALWFKKLEGLVVGVAIKE